eukprot:854639-Amphidinium_carterae.1
MGLICSAVMFHLNTLGGTRLLRVACAEKDLASWLKLPCNRRSMSFLAVVTALCCALVALEEIACGVSTPVTSDKMPLVVPFVDEASCPT